MDEGQGPSGDYVPAEEARRAECAWRKLALGPKLGEGAFGKVYAASETARQGRAEEAVLWHGLRKFRVPPRWKAVKVVDKRKLDTPKLRDRMREEIRILVVASRHRFVVGYHWARETPRRVFLCMEFCAGGDLYSAIDKDRLDAAASTAIIAQIALALNFLHRHRILYRDLKPENVMLTAARQVRLCDFGLAIELTEAHRNKDTGRLETVTASGTLAYAAPEVLQRRPHGIEADWWSLGIVAHELLTAELPFDHDIVNMHSFRICHEPFVPALGIRLGSPEHRFISGLLIKDQPRRRGLNLDDFEDDVLSHDFFSEVDFGLFAASRPAKPGSV